MASLLGALGADSRWLAALGNAIVERHAIPDEVPFATARSSGWENPIVAAELAFDALHAFGERGFQFAQVVAVALGFWLLARDARRGGAADGSIALALLVVLIGTFPSVAVIRVQLFSLAFFPAVLLLLQRETRQPSRRIWLLPVLIAIWSNLHGAVLVGAAVAFAYLLLERARHEPLAALGVLGASTLALCANPAFLDSIHYYRGVLENEAARRGFGLWEPISLQSPFDLSLIAAAILLLALAVRARPRLWEIVVLAALTIMTVRAARSGVWLLFFAAPLAARAIPLTRPPRRAVGLPVAVALLVATLTGLIQGPLTTGASPQILRRALSEARGTPILGEDVLAEQVALEGGQIWIGNPLDAFSRRDQRIYLDWLEGRSTGDLALRNAQRVVLVHVGGKPDRRLSAQGSFAQLARDDTAAVYLRRVAPSAR